MCNVPSDQVLDVLAPMPLTAVAGFLPSPLPSAFPSHGHKQIPPTLSQVADSLPGPGGHIGCTPDPAQIGPVGTRPAPWPSRLTRLC